MDEQESKGIEAVGPAIQSMLSGVGRLFFVLDSKKRL